MSDMWHVPCLIPPSLPPHPSPFPRLQLSYALGSAVVRGFAAIDQKLEDSRLFGALLPNPEVPSAIDATTGSVSKECRQVGV